LYFISGTAKKKLKFKKHNQKKRHRVGEKEFGDGIEDCVSVL
jgi:hypothetical protein